LAHLKKYEGNATALKIEENLYVDNIIMMLDNPAETIGHCNEAKRIFSEAGFNLREFSSNHWMPCSSCHRPTDSLGSFLEKSSKSLALDGTHSMTKF
jgi:hypothetical protein